MSTCVREYGNGVRCWAWLKLRMEEQWMRSQFGETYATYAHQTAALVPYVF